MPKVKVITPFATKDGSYSVDDIAELDELEAWRLARAGIVEIMDVKAPRIETAEAPKAVEKAVAADAPKKRASRRKTTK